MSADEDLRRAAKLARQLADHTIADALDLAVRDHERGSCAAVEQGDECYREMQARDYLAKHRDVPLLSSSDAPNRTATMQGVENTELWGKFASVAFDALEASQRDRDITPVHTQFDMEAVADAVLAVVAPVLAERDKDLTEALALSRALVKRRNREYGRASATIGQLRGALAKKSSDCLKAEAAAASAYLSGNAAGFAAAKVEDPWAQDEADVQQLVENHRAWTKQAQDEADRLRAERDEALAELADIHGDDAPSFADGAA